MNFSKLGKCISNSLCTLAGCTQHFLMYTPHCVCEVCVCVTGGPPACVSSDDGVGVKVVGPHVSEGGGEREGLTGTEGDGNVVSSWSHLAETREGEEGNGGGRR